MFLNPLSILFSALNLPLPFLALYFMLDVNSFSLYLSEMFLFHFHIWSVILHVEFLTDGSSLLFLTLWIYYFNVFRTLLFLMRSQQLNITFSPCMRCVIFFSLFHIHILILSSLQSHSFSSNIITGIILFSSAWGSLEFLDQ